MRIKLSALRLTAGAAAQRGPLSGPAANVEDSLDVVAVDLSPKIKRPAGVGAKEEAAATYKAGERARLMAAFEVTRYQVAGLRQGDVLGAGLAVLGLGEDGPWARDIDQRRTEGRMLLRSVLGKSRECCGGTGKGAARVRGRAVAAEAGSS
jgi:hypothetical protein